MIHFLVTADHDYTLTRYLGDWGTPLADHARVVHYESRPWSRPAAPGAWVFTDIERLKPTELARAREFAQLLGKDPARWKVLNDPRHTLRRYDLLHKLADLGVNDFRAYRVDAIPPSARYPLFLRGEQDHNGSCSPLLNSLAALNAALAGMKARPPLAVEYLPYARADGLYAKYSVMRVGPALVARHILFSHEWEVKDPDVILPDLVDEEQRFIESNPHQEAVLAVFNHAGIGYGRMDYTLMGDRVQVFEINTNPTLVPGAAKLHPDRRPGQARSADNLNQALRQLDAGLPLPDEAQRRDIQKTALRQDRVKNFRHGVLMRMLPWSMYRRRP